MVKKFLIILGILGGIFLCVNPLFKPVDDREVIQFATWGSKSEIEIIRPILAGFEKENPNVRVEFMHIPQNYFQKIHLLFASNTAEVLNTFLRSLIKIVLYLDLSSVCISSTSPVFKPTCLPFS